VATEQVLGAGLGLVERYSTAALSRSARQELGRAMISALRASVPPGGGIKTVAERPADPNLIERGAYWMGDAKYKWKVRRTSKKIVKSKEFAIETSDVVAKGMRTEFDAAGTSTELKDWQWALRRELRAAARGGLLRSEDEETRDQWSTLVFGHRDPEVPLDQAAIDTWAGKVTIEFALQIRARKKLAFLVAELEKNEARQISLATTRATERIAAACFGLAVSVLLGAGGVATAIVLH
jgi:hypothetical protein